MKITQPPFGLIQVQGPDRNPFLHRLLSNDLLLEPGQAVSAYYLNVQGRPLVRLWAFQSQSSTWLLCPSSLTQVCLSELERMHFGERLTLADCSSDWKCTLLLGPRRHEVDPALASLAEMSAWGFIEEPELLVCHFPWLASGSSVIFHREPRFQELPEAQEAWEWERIGAGRAWPSDWGEKTQFLEVAEEEDYRDGKGCYPGQEVVARTLHRGHVNRKLSLLTGSGSLPAAGTALLLEEREVGWISSSVSQGQQIRALGYLRREALELGTVLQRQDGGDLQVTQPQRCP